MDVHVNFVLSQCNQRLHTYLNYCALKARLPIQLLSARSRFSSHYCITGCDMHSLSDRDSWQLIYN